MNVSMFKDFTILKKREAHLKWEYNFKMFTCLVICFWVTGKGLYGVDIVYAFLKMFIY